MPIDDSILLQQGIALHRAGNLDSAAHVYRQLITANPDNFHALHYLGIIEAGSGNLKRAKALLARSLSVQPPNIEFIENYASILFQSGDHDSALQIAQQGLQFNKNNVSLLYVCAVSLFKLKRLNEAISYFDKVLGLQPNHIAAINERGSVLAAMKNYDAALASFEKALALQPGYAEAHLNLGNLYARSERYQQAIFAYERAVSLKPDLADAWLGRGNVMSALHRFDEAFAAFNKALALKHDLAEAWLGCASVLARRNDVAEALAAIDKAFALKPDFNLLEGQRLYAKLQLCDWSNLDEEASHLFAAIGEGRPASDPFSVLSLPSSLADQLQCAKRYASQWPRFPALSTGAPYAHDRIRIAYLSAQFHEHATSYLLAGLFEHHDKSRFEVAGLSFGPDLDSTIRRRLKNGFERFIDVRDKSDQEIAQLVRRLEIDIAIDLVGHTQDARLGVFARRPAPVQVSYLGYLGTMGVEFIDYVIADKIALPFDQQKYYTEKIVHLPDCFLVNDDRLVIAPQTPSRREVGLPDEGFVFCSFNNSYKLSKPMFEVWMRLLARVAGSALWLVESNAQMVINLRREAQRCGIDQGRLIFAPRLPLAEHLARQRLADLFLDTAPYNAGATAAAALWSGVPVLTVLGQTFVGRMAASMLNAVGLPELVAESLPDYEALALKIAKDAAFCAALKDKLARNRETCPLFDTERSTRHIEDAYIEMWQAYRRGHPPESFEIKAED